jgi:excisionase family DNA binding protein
MKKIRPFQSEFNISLNSASEHYANDTDPLWTVDEVALYLRVKPSTVRAMCRRGELPAIKVGRVWRFDKAQLDGKIQNENRYD